MVDSDNDGAGNIVGIHCAGDHFAGLGTVYLSAVLRIVARCMQGRNLLRPINVATCHGMSNLGFHLHLVLPSGMIIYNGKSQIIIFLMAESMIGIIL